MLNLTSTLKIRQFEVVHSIMKASYKNYSSTSEEYTMAAQPPNKSEPLLPLQSLCWCLQWDTASETQHQ